MYQIRKKQKIPVSIDKAWTFFSNPANLGLITPPHMNFKILSRSDAGDMYPGMIISYRISPLFNTRIQWATEITQVKEKEYFIDNQIKGPYKIWHHEHRFRQIPNGIEMEDILYYELPLGWLGKIVHHLMIRKRVTDIFNFREQKIKELFGTL
ncbi:MAG: SRPBCC family protein [Bacteroidales bacterium]|jgi:ligand-binding SRPBCC domain-containing protein|nr:SRPBCC family protein [Bacteroidales bacterium]